VVAYETIIEAELKDVAA